VHGFFCTQNSPELIARGITAIFKWEIWVSRKIMAQYIGNRSDKKSIPEETPPFLTAKEKKVLAIVASGLNNSQIAERLFISHHTVKTHLYNIFKKLNVPNRLQATFRFMKNL
jgi:LuxR family transcriptional regulator of csgAB operon